MRKWSGSALQTHKFRLLPLFLVVRTRQHAHKFLVAVITCCVVIELDTVGRNGRCVVRPDGGQCTPVVLIVFGKESLDSDAGKFRFTDCFVEESSFRPKVIGIGIDGLFTTVASFASILGSFPVPASVLVGLGMLSFVVVVVFCPSTRHLLDNTVVNFDEGGLHYNGARAAEGRGVLYIRRVSI